MDAKLVVVGGEAKSGEVKIKKLPSVVGRGDDADIRLRHPLVSRKHCEIFEQNGLLKVRDLGSLNGTFIANNKVKESVLKPDELITIGPVVFRAVYEGPAGAADDAGEDFDFDLGDDFQVNETQPVDIKKTTSARETVMLEDFDVDETPPKESAKGGGKKESEDDGLADFDDLDFEMALSDDDVGGGDLGRGGAVDEKSPAEVAATDEAMDDDAFADLLENDVEGPAAEAAPEPAPKEAKEKAKVAAKANAPAKPAAPAAGELDFDIEIDGVSGGEDEELNDFLKDLGLEK